MIYPKMLIAPKHTKMKILVLLESKVSIGRTSLSSFCKRKDIFLSYRCFQVLGLPF